jgi:putative membrane protein
VIRPLSLALALLVLAAAYGLPWGAWLGLFPRHMVQHVTLVALAAPLLVLALPARRWAPPILLGAVVEFVVVWGWHLPALHGLACFGGPWKILEQAMFLGSGLLVWGGALGPGQPLAGAGGLLLTSMHMTFLGALLTLAPSAIYAGTCPICGSLEGQQLGGMLMLAVGTPVYLLGALWLVSRALGSLEPERQA